MDSAPTLPHECIESVLNCLAPTQRHECAVDFRYLYLRNKTMYALTHVTLTNDNVTRTAWEWRDDDDVVGSSVIPGTRKYGTYMIFIADVNPLGASATFSCSGTIRENKIQDLSYIKGTHNETVDIVWMAGDYPRLIFMEWPCVDCERKEFTYRVRVMTV